MAEFALIERIRRRAGQRADVVLGIGDDAALLAVPPGRQLVVTMDTLNGGVHFPGESAPSDVGWKALAVNLSDLAAMGASPAWCTLALSLPAADDAWVEGFLDGFLELSDLHGIALVGGDTTRGPLSICVTAHGLVAPGRALRRVGARVGDDVWVSGTLGDAAAALRQWRDGGPADAALRARLDRPTPRIDVGRDLSRMDAVGSEGTGAGALRDSGEVALRTLASACIDLSDGLLADLGHVARASDVAIEIEVDALPASRALETVFADVEARRIAQATGGDDYELAFTASPGSRDVILAVAGNTGVRLTRIGRVVPGEGIRALDAAGQAWQPMRTGFEHFADTPGPRR